METLEQVLTRLEIDNEDLKAALYAREDEVRDTLLTAGAMFGLHPQIAAEVLTNGVPLGTPPSDEVRALVRQTYITHMEELRRLHEEGGQGEQG